MESTGAVGRIQVSQETADELRSKGKQHWLRPREDKIVAKGKGEMQTYWLEPRKKTQQVVGPIHGRAGIQFPRDVRSSPGRGGSPRTRTSANTSSAKSLNSSHSVSKEKLDRLIEYNTDVLLRPLLRSIAARQTSKMKTSKSIRKIDHATEVFEPLLAFSSLSDAIPLPEFDPSRSTDISKVSNSARIRQDLRDFVAEIAGQYNDVPFHNFEVWHGTCLSCVDAF